MIWSSDREKNSHQDGGTSQAETRVKIRVSFASCSHSARRLAARLRADFGAMMSRVAFEVCSQAGSQRSEEHTSELQSRFDLVCRLLLQKNKKQQSSQHSH